MSENGEKLQDAIGMIADEYVEEAHALDESASMQAMPTAKRTAWRTRFVAAAACLVVIVGVGALAFAGLQPQDAMVKDELTTTAESGGKVEADVESYDLSIEGDVADSDLPLIMMKSTDESSVETMAMAADSASPLAAGSLVTGVIDENNVEAEAGMLTAAEWNDNDNWPFFTNLVNAETITFPAFGIDPRHRIRVTVTDATGSALRGESIALLDENGTELWHATSDKDGVAYLFYQEGEVPSSVSAPDAGVSAQVSAEKGGQQGSTLMRPSGDVEIVIPKATASTSGDLQVMFMVDTTGSMSDEIAYLQADFASISAEVGSDGVEYSANFYRDEGEDEEYVTKCNPFTSDIAEVQRQFNDEYADGGGDEPEAVAQIMSETITDNNSWRDDAAKIAFLVFDAPPHAGTDKALQTAVRSAAQRGIRIVPVVASNASRETELFGRALAICTNATYVFLTDDSGIGDSHLEPIVGDYTVESLHDIIVRLINEAR